MLILPSILANHESILWVHQYDNFIYVFPNTNGQDSNKVIVAVVGNWVTHIGELKAKSVNLNMSIKVAPLELLERKI
jgi:hypothetical protein